MKRLKIGYISDLHIDFFVSQKDRNRLQKPIGNYITQIMKPEKSDVLILAGDLSHYNQQLFELLEQLKEYTNDIFVVHGNHDLYLVSNSQRDRYNLQSENRLKEIQEYCDNDPRLHYLDGNVVNINGIKILVQ